MNWANDEQRRIFASDNDTAAHQAVGQKEEDHMFVISGVTGHTGATVAAELLAQGKKLRVIVREAHKGEAWRQRGAEVALADLADAKALTAALRGADGVYALIPPQVGADDMLAAQLPVIDSWAQAIAAARPKHVVLLSSIGAERTGGTGPIVTLHRAEERLRATGVPLTAVRASYFMENWGGVVHPAKADGVLPAMLSLGRPVPMVATADIGRVAAKALVAGPAAGEVIELSGPRDYSPEDVAAAFARALGRPVQPVEVREEAMEPALRQAGLKPKLAGLFREMNVALNRGEIAFKAVPVRGRVEIDEVLRGLVG
jgi:uncharacterized protein YbjT (DUF2867 family)